VKRPVTFHLFGLGLLLRSVTLSFNVPLRTIADSQWVPSMHRWDRRLEPGHRFRGDVVGLV